MKRFFLLIISILCVTIELNAQVYKDEPVFKEGEVATYQVYYNLGFVWIQAGEVVFSVNSITNNGKPCYMLRLAGYTIKSFDNFYCIRDTFSAIVSKEDLIPYHYREVKHEDSYFCDKKFKFSYEAPLTRVGLSFNLRGKLSEDSVHIARDVFDLLTTCYRFRCLDTRNLQKGTFIPFKMLYDKTIYDLGLTYRGKEEIKLKNKNKYNALKFTPRLITGDLFKNENDMAIYVSDDDNHVPLYIEAKIKVGYVKVMLQSVQNTKYPFSAQKKK